MSLDTLESETLAAVAAAADEAALEAVRVNALGKKGTISEQMKALGGMEPEARKTFGAALNLVKDKVADAITARKDVLARAALDQRLASERVDITLPTRHELTGTIHPVSQVWEEIVQIFGDLGFSVAEGPHIEDDFHNFDALNTRHGRNMTHFTSTNAKMALAWCCARTHRQCKSAPCCRASRPFASSRRAAPSALIAT
jgi:phenylalanyl-tRNA synthetase alpha chain